MSFKKTEKYIQKLENIRREPQSTEEEKYDKKEHAREFRMEVMLDNARLAQDLTAQLEYNPWATEKDLAESVQKSAEFLAHPEVAETFIDDLVAAKKRVFDVIDNKESSLIYLSNKNLAQAFYHELVSSQYQQYKINGEMSLDTSYPLAVILYVDNDEDFKRIDPRKNVGGFYSASINNYDPILSKNFEFPLIVVRGNKKNIVESGAIVTEEHEKGHAEHQRFMSTMKNIDIKNVWLKFKEPPSGAIGRLKLLYNRPDSDKALGWKHSENDWNVVMDYALERAKDELLAEFRATGSIEFHLTNLLAKEGVYDYFKRLNIEPNTRLYVDLWKKYESTLRAAVLYANHLINSYKRFGLNQRVDLMRWVFAQIPLRDWENQITRSAFWDEANGLFDILNKPEKVSIDSHQEFLSRFRRNQSYSLLPLIREYQNQLLG